MPKVTKTTNSLPKSSGTAEPCLYPGVPEGKRRWEMRFRHWLSRHLPTVPSLPRRAVWGHHRLPRGSSSPDAKPCYIAGGREGFASQLIKAQQLLSWGDQRGSIAPAGPAAPAALKEDAAPSRGHFFLPPACGRLEALKPGSWWSL